MFAIVSNEESFIKYDLLRDSFNNKEISFACCPFVNFLQKL